MSPLYKKKLIVLISTVIALLIMLGVFIAGVVLICTMPNNANTESLKVNKLIYASMIGVCAFLFILITLNFTSFIGSNKEFIRYLLNRIFKHDKQSRLPK